MTPISKIEQLKHHQKRIMSDTATYKTTTAIEVTQAELYILRKITNEAYYKAGSRWVFFCTASDKSLAQWKYERLCDLKKKLDSAL